MLRPCLVLQEVECIGQALQNSQTNIDLLFQQSHNTTQTRSLLPKIYGPGFNNTVPYDCFSQAVFEIDDIDKIVSMTQDPYYKKYIQKDPPNFADMENTKYVCFCILLCLLRSCLALQFLGY